jgi:hypothetical protein
MATPSGGNYQLALVQSNWSSGASKTINIPSIYDPTLLEYEAQSGLIHSVAWQTGGNVQLILLSINPQLGTVTNRSIDLSQFLVGNGAATAIQVPNLQIYLFTKSKSLLLLRSNPLISTF